MTIIIKIIDRNIPHNYDDIILIIHSSYYCYIRSLWLWLCRRPPLRAGLSPIDTSAARSKSYM